MPSDRSAYDKARYARLRSDPEWVAKRHAYGRQYSKTHPKKRRQRGITPGKPELYRLRHKARAEAAAAGISVVDAYRFHDILLPKDLDQ